MHRKLTITLDEMVYKALHKFVGARRISQFIESLVRPHVINRDLVMAYKEMSENEAREAEALAWSEGTVEDVKKDFSTLERRPLRCGEGD